MWSYWEKQTLLKADLMIVGAGFTGLSTALHYKEQNPSKKVIVIDRSPFSMGASTRNAGFACIGSPTELLMNLESHPPQEVFSLVGKRYYGLSKILSRFGTTALGTSKERSYELLRKEDEDALDQIEDLNQALLNHLPGVAFDILPKGNHPIPQSSEQFCRAVKLNFEYPLHTGKFYEKLWEETAQAGVHIWGGLRCKHWECKPSWIDIEFVDIEGRSGNIQAGSLAICSNGFTQKLNTNRANIRPGRGLIMMTKPLQELPCKGIFHLEKGNVYFRDIDDRILFGGGRHWFKKEEEKTGFEVNPELKQRLMDLAQQVFPKSNLEWEDEWTGVMGFSNQFEPVKEWLNENVLLGAGLNGMGVALSFAFGHELADALQDKNC
jgi:glycine/D-amino acid oxidase-like deaminating enzyme